MSGRSVEFSYAASNHHLKCLAVGSVAIELGMSHTHPSVMSRGLHQETGMPSRNRLGELASSEQAGPPGRPAFSVAIELL